MMNELIEYYEEKKKNKLNLFSIIWFAASGIMFLFLDKFIIGSITWLNQFINLSWILTDENEFIIKFISLLIDFCLPASLTWTIYLMQLKYLDNEGWKKHFPQYDISGKWHDTTVYTNMIDNKGWVETDNIAKRLKEKGWKNDEKQPAIPSMVIIKQTCREIKIDISHGDGFTWKSLSASWVEDRLMILYEVLYTNVLRNKGYPQQRYGFEKMQIDRNNLSPKDRPQKMTGQFWHCIANDGKPIFMGDVTYERII